MAPSSQHYRHNVEQLFAPQFAKRNSVLRRDTSFAVPTEAATPTPSFQSTTAITATSSSSPSGPPGVTLPPHGVPALIGIIITLSLAIFGFAGWRVWVYRRNKKITRTTLKENNCQPVGLYDAVYEEPKLKRSLSGRDADAIAFPQKAGSKDTMIRERTAAEVAVNLGYRPKIVYALPETTAPAPGFKVTPSPPGLQISPPPVYVTVPPPVLSPRTAASMAPAGKTSPQTNVKRPRLVVVESTFTPTLDDELKVHQGETLQLLEEYEDEWCLVQRVGPKAGEKGVVPRFCIVDNWKFAV